MGLKKIWTEAEIEMSLIEFFNSDLFKYDAPVRATDDLLRNGLLDSFGFVTLMCYMDEKYGLSVATEDLLEIHHSFEPA